MALISRLTAHAQRGRRRSVIAVAGILLWVAPRAASAQPAPTAGDPDTDTDGAAQAAATPAYPPGTIPPGFDRIEVTDVTHGMRNDTFSYVAVDPRDPQKVYVATDYGRVYISPDSGGLWTESTVIREQKDLWGTAGQKQLLGHIREGGGSGPGTPPNLAGHIGPGALHAGRLFGDPPPTSIGTPFSVPLVLSQSEMSNPVASLSQAAAGGGDTLVAIGGSSRAPRLSIFLASRGKPVPAINLAKFVLGAGSRPTGVWRIIADPNDAESLFAATANGLYRSTDGGISWVRTFPGLSRKDRAIRSIAFDAHNPDRVYLGSSRGMYISNDRGGSWQRSTRMPGVLISHIVVDPTDSRYMYIAGNGGVWRSPDGGESFEFIFTSSLPRQRDVRWIELDPFDANTAYLATADGVFVTHKLREAKTGDWKPLAGLRTLDLVIPLVRACSRHPGHIYALTRADLHTINYGADGPEVYLIESWDGGKTWRPLASNRTRGDARWFSLDPHDPDTVWIAWQQAVVKVGRAGTGPRRGRRPRKSWTAARADLGMPTIGEVIDHTLDHHGLSLDLYHDQLQSLKSRNWLPAAITVVAYYGRRGYGYDIDDARFDDDRFLAQGITDEWRVMAVASWRLPDLVYHPQAEPMSRLRIIQMNNALRETLMKTVQRSYGELTRLRARMKLDPPADLKTRVLYHLRMEQLAAVVDMASGGYLSRQTEKAKGVP